MAEVRDGKHRPLRVYQNVGCLDVRMDVPRVSMEILQKGQDR